MTISLRVSPEETKLMETYANVHGISVSETLRRAFMQMIEDEIDVEHCIRSIENYEKTKKSYTLDELDAEFDQL